MTVWNKLDAVASPDTIRAVASAREREGTVCISAATGEGIDAMLALLDRYIAALLLPVRCMLPFAQVRPGRAARRACRLMRTRARCCNAGRVSRGRRTGRPAGGAAQLRRGHAAGVDRARHAGRGARPARPAC